MLTPDQPYGLTFGFTNNTDLSLTLFKCSSGSGVPKILIKKAWEQNETPVEP